MEKDEKDSKRAFSMKQPIHLKRTATTRAPLQKVREDDIIDEYEKLSVSQTRANYTNK